MSNINQALNGWLIVIILIFIGSVLFYYMKNVNGETDLDSLGYSGFVISILATLLFFVSPDNGYKLVEWPALAIFYLVTGVCFSIKKLWARY